MTCADDEYTIEWLQIRFSPRGRLWAGGRGNQKTGELRINQMRGFKVCICQQSVQCYLLWQSKGEYKPAERMGKHQDSKSDF